MNCLFKNRVQRHSPHPLPIITALCWLLPIDLTLAGPYPPPPGSYRPIELQGTPLPAPGGFRAEAPLDNRRLPFTPNLPSNSRAVPERQPPVIVQPEMPSAPAYSYPSSALMAGSRAFRPPAITEPPAPPAPFYPPPPPPPFAMDGRDDRRFRPPGLGDNK